MRLRRLDVRLALVALGCVALVGCYDFDRAGFTVINRLSVPIDVIYLRGEDRIVIIDDLTPGNSNMVNRFVNGGECVNDSMIAMDQSGSVVATFPGPVCDGLDWEVEPLASFSPGG